LGSGPERPGGPLKAHLYRRGGAFAGFTVSGHAGYAKHGSDIVCSAVSALTQAAAMGLSEFLNVCGELAVEEGHMRLALRSGLRKEEALQAEAILQTLWLGLSGIREAYPGHLEIEVTEEPS
jgi:uncharacterized protein YsxB (DUF464 family)